MNWNTYPTQKKNMCIILYWKIKILNFCGKKIKCHFILPIKVSLCVDYNNEILFLELKI